MRCNISPRLCSVQIEIMNVSHKVCSPSKDAERAGEDSWKIVEVGRSAQIIGEIFVGIRSPRENSLQWAWTDFNLCLLFRTRVWRVWPNLSAFLSDHFINLLRVIRISVMTACHEFTWHVIQFVKLSLYQKKSTSTSRHCWPPSARLLLRENW